MEELWKIKEKESKKKITTNEKDFLKYASRPTYISHIKFGKDLVVIHEKKELLTLDKPIYRGYSIRTKQISNIQILLWFCKEKM